MTALVGITQGRLVQTPPGVLQRFPQECWQQEMHTAAQLGFSHVEWLVERQLNLHNPIWSDNGCADILRTCEASGLKMYSAVYDYMIDHDLAGNTDAVEQAMHLIDRSRVLGLRMIVMPLFEASEPRGGDCRPYIAPLKTVTAAASQAGIELTLESVLSVDALKNLIDAIGEANVGVCLDSGNRAAAGYDIADDVRRLGPRLRHVHVKDKTAAGENVRLGTGTVDFRALAQALSDVRFSGRCTLETTRGDDPVVTARAHLAFLEHL